MHALPLTPRMVLLSLGTKINLLKIYIYSQNLRQNHKERENTKHYFQLVSIFGSSQLIKNDSQLRINAKMNQHLQKSQNP